MIAGTSWPLTPLFLSTLLLIAAMMVPRLYPRGVLWLRVLWRCSVFVLLTYLIGRSIGSPLHPEFHSADAGDLLWQQLVEAGWWLITAGLAVTMARLLVVLEHRPRETQIISDLLAGAIYVASLLAIVNFAFGVPIRGLLVTSGAIAIVLGLALQSTLSDVFSGIAVGLERPYKAGDLLWVEGGIEGHVIQVNWRSTQIATTHNNIAVVPNSIIAKARLINHSLPTPARGDTIRVRLDASAMPEYCIGTLTAATRACRVPIAFPAPSVACTGLHGDGTVYEINFSVASSDDLGPARTEMYSQIHRHLRYAGIPLAVVGIAAPPTLVVPTPDQLLQQSDLFGVIEPAQRDQLAAHFTPVWLQPGEKLIVQGEKPEALFVIASGTAEITRGAPGAAHVVYRMSPGESLGAIGLITDTPYAATATALTPLKAYRLDKADISAAIKSMPELAAGLEALAQRGQAALRDHAASHEGTQMAQPEMFLSKLRSFLHVLNK